jgi:hypothetical protein
VTVVSEGGPTPECHQSHCMQVHMEGSYVTTMCYYGVTLFIEISPKAIPDTGELKTRDID